MLAKADRILFDDDLTRSTSRRDGVASPCRQPRGGQARMTRAAASQFRWANLLTYLAVAAAAIATMFAQGPSSRFWAGAGIALAMAFDLFDGRFARLFPRTEDERRVGIEIDSLADVMAFGLAPAVCLFRVVPATRSREHGALAGRLDLLRSLHRDAPRPLQCLPGRNRRLHRRAIESRRTRRSRSCSSGCPTPSSRQSCSWGRVRERSVDFVFGGRVQRCSTRCSRSRSSSRADTSSVCSSEESR